MITYIGLDGEMSSADIHTGGKLIQIGMAILEKEVGTALLLTLSCSAGNQT
jgi:hypothetical protein